LGKYSTKVYPSPLSADLAMSSSQVITFSGGVGYCLVLAASSKKKSWNTPSHSCSETEETETYNVKHTAIHFGFTNFGFHLPVNSPLLCLSHTTILIQSKILLLLPISIPPTLLPATQITHQLISSMPSNYHILWNIISICQLITLFPRLSQQIVPYFPFQILGNWLDIAALHI